MQPVLTICHRQQLIGLCKRKGVQIIAVDPFGGALENEAVLGNAAAAPSADAQEGTSAAHVLLAWSAGRGVAAIASAVEGATIEMVSGPVAPIGRPQVRRDLARQFRFALTHISS